MNKGLKIVPVMLAGGRGSRLYELTDANCKPALPMGLNDRIVDWTMHGLAKAGFDTVVVATQYRAHQLGTYLDGRWRDSFSDGLSIREGISTTGRPAGYAGTADAVRCNMDHLRATGADLVLVVAADHVYSMDFSAMVDAHIESGAPVTVAASVVDKSKARDFGVFEEAADGRIVSFTEKPSSPVEIGNQPGCSLVSMGIYIFDMKWLDDALASRGDDFGHDILPRAYARNEANCYRAVTANGAPIYWKDVGTLDAYRETWISMEQKPWLCSAPSGCLTRTDDRLLMQGTVALPGCSVSLGAQVRNAILASGVRLEPGETIGLDRSEDRRWFRVTGQGTVLVTPQMIARRNAYRRGNLQFFEPAAAGNARGQLMETKEQRQ